MNFDKINTFKKAISDLNKKENATKQAILDSKKKEISRLKSMKINTSVKPEVIYEKPKWKKRLDGFITNIQYLLWKLGLYR